MLRSAAEEPAARSSLRINGTHGMLHQTFACKYALTVDGTSAPLAQVEATVPSDDVTAASSLLTFMPLTLMSNAVRRQALAAEQKLLQQSTASSADGAHTAVVLRKTSSIVSETFANTCGALEPWRPIGNGVAAARRTVFVRR